MVRSLLVASNNHGQALNAANNGSDSATQGEAIVPPEQDGRPRPVVFYVGVAKKTIDRCVVPVAH